MNFIQSNFLPLFKHLSQKNCLKVKAHPIILFEFEFVFWGGKAATIAVMSKLPARCSVFLLTLGRKPRYSFAFFWLDTDFKTLYSKFTHCLTENFVSVHDPEPVVSTWSLPRTFLSGRSLWRKCWV